MVGSGPGAVERVQILVEMVTRGLSKGVDQVGKSMKTVGKNVNSFNKELFMSMDGFRAQSNALNMSREQFAGYAKTLQPNVLSQFGLGLNRNNKIIDINSRRTQTMYGVNKRMTSGLKTGAGKAAYGVRNLTHGMKGFRMEALGVMFFGMMMQQMFLGFLQPVMKAFGVFELISMMLLVVFLPVMELIFPIILQFIEFFMNLPEPVKLFIGVLVVLGAVLGTLIMYAGAFVLGIGSLILFLPLVTAFMSPIIGVVLLVIGAIVALIAIFYGVSAVLEHFGYSWDDVWNSIMGIVNGAIDFIMDIVNVFADFFLGIIQGIAGEEVTWEQLWEAFSSIVDTVFTMIKNIIKAAMKVVGPIIADWLDDIKNLIGWIKIALDYAGDLAKGAGQFIGGGIRSATNFFTGQKDDFIWRPGSGAVSINPNDTLVGFKGNSPFGGGEGVVFSPTYNIQVLDRAELERELNNRDKRMVDDIRRLVKQ